MAGLITNLMNGTSKNALGGRNVFTGNATTVDPETRSVNADTETVSGQLTSLLKKDSPLTQMARTSAKQNANSRGLVNSAMAVGAGEYAAIQSALPIAQQDANTFTQASMDNMGAKNSALSFNAGQMNNLGQFNATQQNAFGRADQDTENQKMMIGEQGTQTRLTQSEGAGQALSLTNRKAEIDRELQTLQGQQASGLSAQQAQQQLGLQASGAAFDQALQTLRGDQAKALADVESNWRGLIQASTAAQTIFTAQANNIAAIMANTDTTAEQKQAAVNTLTQMIENGLTIVGGIQNLDLAGLLDFSET